MKQAKLTMSKDGIMRQDVNIKLRLEPEEIEALKDYYGYESSLTTLIQSAVDEMLSVMTHKSRK
jgi:hypothetical protein